MIIVKITILLVVLWIIWGLLVASYLKSNLEKAIKVQFTQYCPWYMVINAILALGAVIGIIASVVYLLFFM